MQCTTEDSGKEKQELVDAPTKMLSSHAAQPSLGKASGRKFLKGFFIGGTAAVFAYYSLILLMIGAPIPAEYWAGEMITVKKEMVRKLAGRQKIILAGGSSTLFGVNTEEASRQLHIPVVNFGLHAGLRLGEILWQVGSVVEPGDSLILLLEPPYFAPQPQLSSSQIENIIGWDREGWREMTLMEKGQLVCSVPLALFYQMLTAEYKLKFRPASVAKRLASLDSSLVLSKFRNRQAPSAFKYSAYNLNDSGDMLMNEGSTFKGKGFAYDFPSRVDGPAARCLPRFLATMKTRGVRVYFANPPYVASGESLEVMRRAEQSFLRDLGSIGQMIDRREDLVFDVKYFFNTELHLNSEGRALRTDLLIKAIRKNVLIGAARTTLEEHSASNF